MTSRYYATYIDNKLINYSNKHTNMKITMQDLQKITEMQTYIDNKLISYSNKHTNIKITMQKITEMHGGTQSRA